MHNKTNQLPKSSTIARVFLRKGLLLAAIAVTSLAPLLYLDLNEPTAELLVFKVLAKTGSLVALMLFAWQFFLGFRGLAAKALVDLVWVVGLHKWLGVAASLLLLLHPVFITLYYLRKFNKNLFGFDLSRSFDWFVLLGIIAFALLALIYLTSVHLRRFLATGQWFVLHLSSYLLLPLALIHARAIGMTIGKTPLRHFWTAMVAVMAGVVLYRLLFRFGLFSERYTVAKAHTVADKVIDITLHPLHKGLMPKMGQFVYIRRKPVNGAHAYTVSAFDKARGELSITVKEQGVSSAALQQVQTGESIMLDGPYGVFTWHALESQRPVVMLAGGIGITPYRRLLRVLEQERSREAWLFYGNERKADIVYGNELDNYAFVKVVHILNSEPEYPGEKGFVSIDILQKHLGETLSRYEFLLCGPPIMITTIESALRARNIPAEQIHHELFGW